MFFSLLFSLYVSLVSFHLETPKPVVVDNNGQKYNFTYLIQMDIGGNILLLFRYRFYYEASASVNFTARTTTETELEFSFDGIGKTGYVMTTGGRTGNSIHFFTADYDLERGDRFREERLASFLKNELYYSKHIKKVNRFPMQILSQDEDSIQFIRNTQGQNTHSEVNLSLSDPGTKVYSNIYKILGEMLLIYDHSYLPSSKEKNFLQTPNQTWDSEPLEFTQVLNKFVALVSEDAKKYAKFNQKEKFKLTYKIIDVNDSSLTIRGESFPEVNIRKNIVVTHVYRTVVISQSELKEDAVYVKFQDKKDRIGILRMTLSRIE